MENLTLEPGDKTPGINLNADECVLKIWGRSIPENSVEYYKPVFDWFDEYAKNSGDKTEMIFQLEYFNTSSSKCILDILRKLKSIEESGKSKVTVKWLYEEDDEDMMEAGDDYQTIVNLPFDIEQA
jgi:SiaC family regulatory phosphoprotein